jgi:hypothetical protein
MAVEKNHEMREKVALFLQTLDSRAKRDAVEEQVERLSSPEATKNQLQIIRQRLREMDGEQPIMPKSGEQLKLDDGKVVSLGAHRAAQDDGNLTQAQPANLANDDGFAEYRMAASGPQKPLGWTLTDFVLSLPDREIQIFVNPEEGNCVFMRAEDCELGWSGLRLGGYSYDFTFGDSDREWIGLLGCIESTLRKAKKGGHKIDVSPI